MLTIGRLRAEVRELQGQNVYLRNRVDTLQTVLHVAEITKIFNSTAPGCVYHRYFTGVYRQQILTEIITRYCSTYCSTQRVSDHDDSAASQTINQKFVAHIMRSIGNECTKGVLKTSFGDVISFDGG